jgi:hypothetical protein
MAPNAGVRAQRESTDPVLTRLKFGTPAREFFRPRALAISQLSITVPLQRRSTRSPYAMRRSAHATTRFGIRGVAGRVISITDSNHLVNNLALLWNRGTCGGYRRAGYALLTNGICDDPAVGATYLGIPALPPAQSSRSQNACADRKYRPAQKKPPLRRVSAHQVR